MVKYFVFLFFLFPSIIFAGPLDLEEIKKECFKEYQNESSNEYTKCLKTKINNILYKKKNDN